jgi:aspartate/tyrosine/aromatic aminotransferase
LYDELVTMQDGQIVRVPFPGDFSLPPALADVEAKLTILCHPNAPSGTMPSLTQVEDLARRVRGILVIDEAYIDFADETALPLIHKYPHVVILRTFSKSFSLYGERVGALSAVCASREEADRVLSQLKRVIRTNYSNPPTFGGQAVATIMETPELRTLWEHELAEIEAAFSLICVGCREVYVRKPPDLQGRVMHLRLPNRGLTVHVFRT